jgi:glycosyltransferase involved in cell wall biosynthesis
VSYYTHHLATALSEQHAVSVLQIRQLIPTRLYPGKNRVGTSLARLDYPSHVPVFDGIDWYWIPSLFKGLKRFRRQHADVLILEWWTGATLHTYLALAVAARLSGAKVVLEFHEIQDVGELALPLTGFYVNTFMALLLKLTDGFVVHSKFDLKELQGRYRLTSRPTAVIRHGPYGIGVNSVVSRTSHDPVRDETRLLYFGIIRPFKGVEDLIRAFNMLSPMEVLRYSLTIVGETWENWTLPAQLISSSPYRSRIQFVNEYVKDDEVPGFFAAADVVVLPYHRSSASGPLHIAMAASLPVIVTDVGGLREAAGEYPGAVFVPPRDPTRLVEAIRECSSMSGQPCKDSYTWADSVAHFENLFAELAIPSHKPLAR